MAKNDVAINLASQESSQGFYDNFLSWALGIGKLVVIITELIALIAFIYRFSLDNQIANLNTQIQSEQLITESYAQNEKIFRNLQSRLSYASTYNKQENSTIKSLFDIEALLPSNIKLNSVAFTSSTVTVAAVAYSTDSLKSLTSAFQSSPDFSNIKLDQIDNSTSNGTITANYTLTLK